jgi:hypothetical protein
MPARAKEPTFKSKAKGSELSPKEIQWLEKQRAATLAANAAARQARVLKVAEPVQVPDFFCKIASISSWFTERILSVKQFSILDTSLVVM